MRVTLTKGDRFGRWVVLQEVERKLFRGGKRKGKIEARQFLCKCDCGNEGVVVARSLVTGKSKSCRCLQKEIVAANQSRVRHGHSFAGKETSTYVTWKNMRYRCRDKTDKYYGERGITVCKRWHKYENFLADMGERPEGLSIDRIDNDKGYCKENCRWADALTQSRNRRHTKYV